MFLQNEGRLAGCWVMRIEDGATDSASPAASDASERNPSDAQADADEPREKVIVRSNGVVTYVGKDIANQFWKFGLLGKDFLYRQFTEHDGRPLWATTSSPAVAPGMSVTSTITISMQTRPMTLARRPCTRTSPRLDNFRFNPSA